MVGKVATKIPMPIRMRAKQFAMFDALKGLREAIAEKERPSCSEKELAADRIDEINQKLSMLQKGATIEVEYFGEHGMKRCLFSGNVEKVDTYRKTLQVGNVSIGFSEIIDIHLYYLGNAL